MKRYRVIFTTNAIAEIAGSFEWGKKYWGEHAAKLWYQSLRQSVRRSLSSTPLAWPLAPEDEVYTAEVRNMFVGRYRILFSIEKRTISILHIRGAFVDPPQRPFDEEEK